MNTIILCLAISFAFGSNIQTPVNLAFEFDIEAISRRDTSVGRDTVPVILNDVDLNSLVLIKCSGRYYVKPRDSVLCGVPELLLFAMVQFQKRSGPLMIGFDEAIVPKPKYTVGFLEGLFRHFAGLPLNASPSDEEVKFINVVNQDDPQADPTFGTLPVGHISIDSVEASFARNGVDISFLLGRFDSSPVLVRLDKVAFVTRLNWLLDSSHHRFVFSCNGIPDPGVPDQERAMSFAFIDASLWTGEPKDVLPFLRMVNVYAATLAGLRSQQMISGANSRLHKFMTELNTYLSRAGSSTDFMEPVKSINRVVGDSLKGNLYYEIVFNG